MGFPISSYFVSSEETGSVRKTVSTHSAAAVSLVFRGWLEDTSDQPTPPTFRMKDIGANQLDVFAKLINSIDSDTEDGTDTFLLDNSCLLVRPLHKYDCPGLWKRLLSLLNTSPRVDTLLEIDSIETLPPAVWMTETMCSYLENRRSEIGKASDRLVRHIFLHGKTDTTPPAGARDAVDQMGQK